MVIKKCFIFFSPGTQHDGDQILQQWQCGAGKCCHQNKNDYTHMGVISALSAEICLIAAIFVVAQQAYQVWMPKMAPDELLMSYCACISAVGACGTLQYVVSMFTAPYPAVTTAPTHNHYPLHFHHHTCTQMLPSGLSPLNQYVTYSHHFSCTQPLSTPFYHNICMITYALLY